MADTCPGCGVTFAPFVGPTHRYIGANAACWALYTTVLVRGEPAPELLEDSHVSRPSHASELVAAGDLQVLFADAYAAQHHGVPSRVATQSVDVHLLTLYGVIRRGVAPKHAEWARSRGLRHRDRGVYEWLEPPPLGAALSVRHLFPGGGVREPCSIAAYVVSVLDSWEAIHGDRLQDWYDRYVLADA